MTAAVLMPVNHTAPMSISAPAATTSFQSQPNKLSSPVEPNGSFSFDAVIKSGWLMKRTRKTKNWKKRWFVLRGDRLSCYKDKKEYKVHRQIILSELTACAMLKHTKRDHVFGLFSPSKNYHLQGENHQDAQEWVELLRKTAGLKETGEEFMLSPNINEGEMPQSPLPTPSSPQFIGNPSATRIQPLPIGSLSCQTLEYSGAEVASCSSFSDIARISQLSLSQPEAPAAIPEKTASDGPNPGVRRNETGLSTTTAELDQSRVIWHGYLYCLKSKGGVRQWKKLWVVLRPVNVAFYKSEEEYRTIRLIPLDSVIDAVDIDPLSKSKKCCFQLISEDKSYRFAASNEEQLAKCLGAIKVTLAKHRKLE